MTRGPLPRFAPRAPRLAKPVVTDAKILGHMFAGAAVAFFGAAFAFRSIGAGFRTPAKRQERTQRKIAGEAAAARASIGL